MRRRASCSSRVWVATGGPPRPRRSRTSSRSGSRSRRSRTAVHPYTDATGTWATLRKIEDEGAILVRPDNHVGWRSFRQVEAPAEELSRAVSAILSR
ncbi:hypothetical protein [Amycolatopsis methanolica]|uniref:aromatic-ring hydroxylase C-terminal domain-containing protein n=1 Tax=Amycolatopsis methanolica TaxID=1814 RepID=UPI00341BBBDF